MGESQMKQKKSCSNCLKGIQININNDILCRIKGVVSQDYVCSKHKTVPIAKSIIAQKHKCIDCEFFIQSTVSREVLPTIGFCQLFTVRQYDGEQKSACSKFSKKSELIVS
jgi:hypothetical protein